MKQRIASVLGVVLFAPSIAVASPTFPDEVRAELDPPCLPGLGCTICHQDDSGGFGTLRSTTDGNDGFGDAMFAAGLIPGDPSTVGPALDVLEEMGSDVDGDGAPDVEEIRVGSDPNDSEAELCAGDASVEYGCVGRIEPRGRLDLVPSMAALFAVLGLVVSRRFRKYRRGRD